MHDDDAVPGVKGRKPKNEAAAELPGQLGQKLRAHFADMESQPVPEDLRKLLEALAAKELKPK